MEMRLRLSEAGIKTSEEPTSRKGFRSRARAGVKSQKRETAGYVQGMAEDEMA